jgi:hypothetical protein
MPQPIPYTRTTDFSAEESAAVSGRSTLRSSAVDAELDGVAANLAGLNQNLALLQRDDGELRDSVVKLHTLAGDVRALLGAGQGVPRGPWATATAYAVRDIVTQGGNSYICALPHTAGVFATDLSASRWMLLSLGGSPDAVSVPFAPAGGVAATNVQAAIEELGASRSVSQAGAGAVSRAVQAKLREYPDAGDYSTFAGYTAANPVRGLWTGQGARPQRITDRLMVGSATRNDGAQSPAVFDWPNDPALRDGIYQYIPNNAVVSAGAFGTGLALAGWARTSTGAGGGGEAALGVTGFAYNDYEQTNRGALTVSAGVPSPLLVSGVGVQGDFYTVTTGGALSTPINGITSLTAGQQIRFHNGAWRVGSVGPGAWALYGTALRRSSKIVGFTHAMELDIANAGDDVDLAPANMFAAGGTHAAWIGAGGEAAQHGGPALGRVSAAIGIIANDPTTAGLTAGSRFLAGIVFQNLSLYGCDGSTGEADWLRISPGHRMSVLNNTGEVVSRLLTTNTVRAKAQRLNFSTFGLLLQDDATGKTHFQVEHVASAVNYIALKPNVTGQAVELMGLGDDPNVSVIARPKGSGTFGWFGGSVTTVGASGAAAAPPGQPVEYARVIFNGQLRQLALYNV